MQKQHGNFHRQFPTELYPRSPTCYYLWQYTTKTENLNMTYSKHLCCFSIGCENSEYIHLNK